MTDINKIKTVCSFYASDWHLVTMLLPNINKKINKGIKITAILEKDLRKNMETLLNKLHLENKKEILNIGWNKNKLDNIKELIKNNDCVIIVGSSEYIKHIHLLIEDAIDKNKEISLIDCYDINECEPEMKKILNEHEKILNTAGEKEKSDYIMSLKIHN